MKTRTICALLAVLIALPTTSQTQLPRAGETIEVSIVNVDVVVTDRRGNHIRGLKASDFEIRDNGVVQPITNFAEYDDKLESSVAASALARGATTEPLAAAPSRERRAIALFVEHQVLPPREADRFIVTMKKLLHDTMRPGDIAAVVAFHYVSKVEQEFTSDLTKLDAAVDRLRPMFEHIGENTEGEVIRNAYMQELLDEAAIDAGGSPVPSLILNGTERAVREMIDMRRKAASLTVLINAMAAMDGRKALLMATRRFGEYAGWEFIGCGLCPPGTEQERFNMRMLHDDLTKNANAAAVTLYTVYPEGLVDIPMANVEQGPRPYRTFYRTDAIADAQKLSKSNAILLNETKAITDLAQKTGGTSGWGFTDVDNIARAMSEDLSSYYSLAFRAPEQSRNHRIKVTTKNRGYIVRARNEFVAKSEELQMSERIISALYEPQKLAGLPIEVQILDVKKAKGRYHVPIVITIPVAALTAVPGEKGRTGSFRVYSAAGGVLGINSDVFQKSQPFTIPENDTTKAFTYEFEMVTDYRCDRIAVGVYDELSHQYGVIRVRIAKTIAPSQTGS